MHDLSSFNFFQQPKEAYNLAAYKQRARANHLSTKN
jgi:hypothetical protein